jgi:5-(carboxyamino)imidazole ribonucleotide synthase
MVNLLGDIHYEGDTIIKGLYEALTLKGVSVHIYGKKQSKPKRKMGHITAVADTVARAKDLAERAYDAMWIISDKKTDE